MSMKKKIFGVVGLLIVLALVILGIGLYGMSRLDTAIDDYIRLTDRTAALAEIDKIALRLSLAEKNLIIETTDEGIKTIVWLRRIPTAKPSVSPPRRSAARATLSTA